MSDLIPDSSEELLRKAKEARFLSMEKFFRFMQEEEFRIEEIDGESKTRIKMGLYQVMVKTINIQNKALNSLRHDIYELRDSLSDPGPT
jgi:endo-1,4-beta-D-glucanase Y